MTQPLIPGQERAAADPQDIVLLYDAYFKRVYTYIRYRISDPQVTDDLTELVFETLLTHLGQYAPERGPFEAWLFAIVRNVVNQHFRRSRLPWLNWEIFANRATPDPLPEETVLQRETQDELLVALSSLDERTRDLVALKFVARLTNRQIAAITGLKESHVGVILFRAIAQVRRDLQAAESGNPIACQGQEQKNGRA